jgi:peptide/nickel transport system substrate-binding protein
MMIEHTIKIMFGASAAVAAACFALLLTACGDHRAPSPAAITFDLAADPRTLNPLLANPDAATVEAQLARLSFEPFIDVDAQGRLVPCLLTSIPTRGDGDLSVDGRTIRYHLRAVRWSDGVPVTADDVLFTLRAILDPRNAVRSHEGYDLIDRAYAPDARTVVLHLRHAWAPAVATYFSSGLVTFYVLPAHAVRAQGPLGRAPFNSAPAVIDGPFTLRWWRRGEGLRYEANPRYWRGRVATQSLVVRIVPDPSTNLLLLQSGELDWNLLAPAQLAVVRTDPQLRFVTVPTAVVAGLAFNAARPPLSDARLRRALAMSIDRTAISRKITLGIYPVTNMLQPQSSWAFDRSVREPAYDPNAADALFDAAGWPRGSDGQRRKGGEALRLLYVQFPETATGVRVAADVQAELRDRGVDVTVKAVSNAQLFLPRTGVLATGNFDMAYVPWTMGADPDDSAVLRCGAPSNYMHWCNRRVDALESAALAQTDRQARKSIYRNIAQIVARDVPVLYLFNADYVYAYRRRLQNFAPNAFVPTWNAYGWSLTTRAPLPPR